MQKILATWAGLSSHFIGDCFDIAKPYLDKQYGGMDAYVRFVSSHLFIDCHLSSESSLLLIREAKEWDADIINRSVMEGTIKYVFLMDGKSSDIQIKAYEYWEQLPNYMAIKHHERASNFLNEVPNPDDPEWIPFKKLLLTEQEIDSLRNGTNRADRNKLEQKWSFSEITKSFSVSQSKGLRLLVHLAHGYGMSSHLIHKDGDGVGMVWERYGRNQDEQFAVKLAHCARIVSDLCTFSKLRLFWLLKFCNQKTDVIHNIEERYQILFDELRKAGQNFTKVEYEEELNNVK
ncbi:DUF5677 domain-containing protein [Methylomonas sp. ZR1]|uniref:DUF5677 domain-containing protein n=1 Tax=Methylomonas sp. ZR1 TaxID=1797072 RepID=UPI0014920F87|nr:DUF5677 domain-containing protein [Methylomonas sp. ZR1]NOV28606.1 hypothetical protein [Methylomonas sp. ZR1]